MAELVTLLVEKPLYGGDCVARDVATNEQVRVPFAIAGERVTATVADAARRGEMRGATLVDVVERADQRVAPTCRHFGACGGCQLQHMSQAAQLHAKVQVLSDTFTRAGLHNLPAMQVSSAEPWGYRNRIRLRVKDDEIGYSRRGTNVFLPVAQCPIASPLLWRAATAMRELARWPVGTHEVEIFATADDAAMQMAVHVDATVATVDRDAPRSLRAMCEALQASVPQLVGAGLLVGAAVDAKSKRVQESARVEIARWGAPGLTYRVGEIAYGVTRNAFFQVNRYLTTRMVDLVLGTRGGAQVWDLFAGAGLFSVPLTQRFAQVIAVEIGEPAANDLAKQLRACGPGHDAERSTVLAFLQRASAHVPDVIVMDPPRAGLGGAVVQALLRIQAPELVYVSCDPVSFARDARALLDSDYTMYALHLIDMFPQTFHTETVAVFRRN